MRERDRDPIVLLRLPSGCRCRSLDRESVAVGLDQLDRYARWASVFVVAEEDEELLVDLGDSLSPGKSSQAPGSDSA
jgi:hypothetical protein